MSTIGDYIKQERKRAGLTQEEFALRWDFDLSGNWNRGRKL